MPFREGGKVGRSDATPINFFSKCSQNVFNQKKMILVASLLPTFPPSRNGISGPTPPFIALTHSHLLLKKFRNLIVQYVSKTFNEKFFPSTFDV